jgi:hypothetical protein
MATAWARFLKQRYGGYFHRDIPPEDAELTHVGPGTPGGEYLRRFWQPVCFSDDLKGVPLKVRMLGEDLVAYRPARCWSGGPRRIFLAHSLGACANR